MKKILLFFVLIGTASGLFSQILRVPQEFQTIQSAIDSSSMGDTILVDEGTYFENVDFLGKSITLASMYLQDGDTSHISKTILDGSLAQDSVRAATVTITGGGNSGMVLSGFTITGGSGNNYPESKQYHGGGIFIFGNGAIIEHNFITENNVIRSKGASGGLIAVLNENDTLIFRHNQVVNNQVIAEHMTASGGMTVVSAKNAFIEISDNVIENNKVFTTAVYKAIGGGIYLQADYSDQATIAFTRNLVSGNELHCQSSFGGGVYIVYTGTNSDPSAKSQVNMYNNIISENYSQDKGGGIAVWNTGDLHIPVEPVIANNTVIGNIASDGSGLFNYDARTLIFNNIFRDSLSGDNSRDLFNSDISGYCFQDGPHWCKNRNDGILYAMYNDVKGGWPGTGNIEVQPKFEENTFDLQKNSYCIGQGTDSVQIDGMWYRAPSTDFYGEPRPSSTADNKPDLGATESPWEGYVYIPDTAFLYSLFDAGVDTNGDQLISYPEAESVHFLDVGQNQSYSISNLKGLSAFRNLDSLDISENGVKVMDASGLPNLKWLNCCSNAIRSIDVSQNPALSSLDLCCNALHSELDLFNNPALEYLFLSGASNYNIFFTVDVTGNPLLKRLDISNNMLSSIDVTHNPDLVFLNIDENVIRELDLSHNPRLKTLNCWDNPLTQLDLRNNDSINELSLGDCPDLTCVSVWENFPDGVILSIEDSPGFEFTTGDCLGSDAMNSSPSIYSLFPNPVHGSLTVHFSNPGLYRVEITSVNGQCLHKILIHGDTGYINISDLDNGVYLVAISSSDFVAIEEIVKL